MVVARIDPADHRCVDQLPEVPVGRALCEDPPHIGFTVEDLRQREGATSVGQNLDHCVAGPAVPHSSGPESATDDHVQVIDHVAVVVG
tara:strand:+ start:1326 stop:1589 length:264 start_codon:yes stop_codon:yes gene_type:complete